jgi:hypothetical protein
MNLQVSQNVGYFLTSEITMRAIWKVTSRELIKTQAMRKKNLLYARNKYILKLLLTIVTI